MAVTPSQLDCLVQLLLEETHNKVPLKTVLRPSSPQQVTEGLVAGVAECRSEVMRGRGRGGEGVRRAWQVWRERRGAVLSVRQFVSMLDLIGSDRSIEETVVDCQLVEVWDVLGGAKEEKKPVKEEVVEEKQPIREEEEIEEKEEVTFDMETISRWYRKTRNIPECPVKIIRRLVTNPRLYWSNERLESLSLAARKALRRWGRFSREKKRKWSLLQLMQMEYKRIEPECTLSVGEIAGKLVSVERRRRAREAKRESSEILEITQEYLQFLDSEVEVETLEPVKEEHVDDIEKDESGNSTDFNNDDVVLQYIREKEGNKKTQHSLVWNYTAVGQLLQARALAKGRRQEWEAWAVRKHGTLQTAYSNPRVKVPKLDELLVEEWGKIRPNQADLSAWTLTSYLRKFDNLKKTLIEEQEEEKRKKREVIFVTDCFPASSIPKYDLEQIAARKKLPKEVAMLIGTRQRAKLRQLEDPSCRELSYLELWRQQWLMEGGVSRSGCELRERLRELEKRFMVRARLKRCLVRKQTTIEDLEKEKVTF